MLPGPAPPPSPGLTWRPATLGDAAGLAALFAAADAAEDLEEPIGPDGARYYLTFPGLDPAEDTLVAAGPDGELAGFAWAWVQESSAARRALLWIETRPEHTGLESILLGWAEARARPRLESGPPGGRRHLRLHVEEHRARRRAVFETAGFRHARTFVEMHRPLDSPPGPPPPLPGIAVVPWAPELDEAAREASNEAFAHHWDSIPLSSDEWRGRITGDSVFRPELSRLAVHDGEVVALCLAAVDPEYNEQEGIAELWVDRVATRPTWQRRGLGAALIAEVLAAGALSGLTRAGLTVDQDNTSRASALYERLGFVAERRTLAYVKALDSAGAPPT